MSHTNARPRISGTWKTITCYGLLKGSMDFLKVSIDFLRDSIDFLEDSLDFLKENNNFITKM